MAEDLAVLTERTLGGLKIQAVEEHKAYINMMVYGDPGVGKTVLAGSAADVEEMSPVLFVDVEGGTFSLREKYPHVEVVRVMTWKEMQSLYNDLYAGKGGYRTIVLDSLTEIQKFNMMQVMVDLITKDGGPGSTKRDPDVPGMQEWGKNIEQIRKFVRAFRDLPINTIFTALATHEKDTKTGLTMHKPGLSGKLANEVAGFLDIVMYMYTKEIQVEEEGEPKTVNKRLLLTQKTQDTVAKDRSNKLPMIIQDTDMQTVYNHIFNKENN